MTPVRMVLHCSGSGRGSRCRIAGWRLVRRKESQYENGCALSREKSSPTVVILSTVGMIAFLTSQTRSLSINFGDREQNTKLYPNQNSTITLELSILEGIYLSI